MRTLMIAGALLASACATTGDVATMSNGQLCDAIDRPFADNDAIAAELIARDRYTPEQLARLRVMETVPIGSPLCDLYVIHGRPDYINSSNYRGGSSHQYVYGTGPGYRFYVYVDETGHVTGTQY